VTWELIQVAGWETTACLQEVSVLLSVTIQPQLSVWRETLSVTLEYLQRGVGWETTACLRALSAPQPATYQLLLTALMVTSPATWGLLQVAGWETTACLQEKSVL